MALLHVSGRYPISSLPKIVDSIYRRRATILKTKVLVKEADTRGKIAEAGLDPDKTESALKILRQLAINPASPEGQRLSDETYRELLKPWPPKDEGRPPEDESGPPEDEGGGVVLPFPVVPRN